MKDIKTFELTFPIPRSLCGIHMGNGNLGALIWGDETLNITVNRSDFWDHQGGELLIEGTTYDKIKDAFRNGSLEEFNGAFLRADKPEKIHRPQRVPVGRFEFCLSRGVKLDKAILEYDTGELAVYVKDGRKLIISLGARKNIMLIDDADHLIEEVKINPSWNFKQSREWLDKDGFEAPENVERENARGWVQACPEDPSLASVCKRKDDVWVIGVELGEDNDRAVDLALDRVDSIEETAFKEDNSKWWRAYWKNIASINVPDEFFNQFYKYALYKFAGATSPESPIPAGLQGPWIEEYHRAQWSGDYHFNVNVQQIYSLALSLGKVDHMLPLFDMIESDVFWNNMRHNARVMFGIDDALLLTHAVDDRGMQVGGIGPGSTLDQACGGWTAQLYWLYYKNTLDKEFLEQRAWPFMTGIMRVYEEMLEEVDGVFSIPVAISAEYGCRNPNGKPAGKDPSYQLAVIHMLLNALFEACEVLGREPKSIWREMKEKTPHYTIVNSLDSYLQPEDRIAVWEGQDLEVCHRHHSHLGCIYPFDSLPKEKTPEMEEILHNSLDNWILMGMGQWSEWCIPWAAILQARTGMNEAPAVLLNMWKEIFVNEGMNTVYLPRFAGLIAHRRHDMNKPKEEHEVMQIDGTMGCATALLEMLAHYHSGVVKLFGGVPMKWKDVAFENIHLPDSIVVSGERMNGDIQQIRVKSGINQMITLDVGVHGKFEVANGSAKQNVSLPGKLELKVGEVVLTPCD